MTFSKIGELKAVLSLRLSNYNEFASAKPSGVLKMKTAGSSLGPTSHTAAFQVVSNPRDHENDVMINTHAHTHI